MDESVSKEMPLWDHFAELSKRLRIWVTSFLVATLIFMLLPADSSFLSNPLGLYRPFISVVLESVKSRVLPSNVQLIAGSFSAPILLYFTASAVFGFIVTAPLLAFELYRFIHPALTRSERSSAYPFVMGFSLLFTAGAVFGFLILTPLVIWGSLYFFSFTGATAFVRVEDFYGLVFFSVVASALAFTLPLFFVLLVKFNILERDVFTKNRKYLWIIIYVITGVVTPEGNPVSDLLLFIPVIALVEGALLVAKRYDNKRTTTGRLPGLPVLRCVFCTGPIDAGGTFCGRCGRSRM